LPDAPGVYLMKDGRGRVIYVGKAARLNQRVRNYFQSEASLDPKTRLLTRRIADFDFVVTPGETEALLLEDQLIKEYRPRYNIRLKDDKRFPWLKLSTSEPFPRLSVIRRPADDGDEYYGPYSDSGAMRRVLKTLTGIFPIRTCHLDLPEETVPRPCLDYYIQRCGAPCVGYVDREAYGRLVQEVRLFLSGRSDKLLRLLRERMENHSGALRFEEAARVRDQIEAVEKVTARQKVVLEPGRDVDVLGLEREGRQACGVILRIRDGKLLHTESYELAAGLDDDLDEFFRRFTSEVLGRERRPAREILLMRPVPQQEDWERVLGARVDRRVRLRVPRRGPAARLVEMAVTNARWKLRERRARTDARAPVVRQEIPSVLDLKQRLELAVAPHSIECFDMSHFQGAQRVGALVYFQAGEPLKSRYRRFSIRQVEGIDDFAMMQEVLERYYSRLRDEDRLPADLVVVDGGAGQLGVAVKTLRRYGFVETAVVGLAKREEEIHLPGRPDPVRLPRSSPGLRLLQRARDEAHRFAVGYHRRLRGKELRRSVLDEIPGIGAAKKRALLEHFGSAEAVSRAPARDLLAVRGIGEADTERILAFFATRSDGR
jgi:excinuclease ABC subunit C